MSRGWGNGWEHMLTDLILIRKELESRWGHDFEKVNGYNVEFVPAEESDDGLSYYLIPLGFAEAGSEVYAQLNYDTYGDFRGFRLYKE